MKCPCGQPLKPSQGKGRPSRYCSERCANRYRKQHQRTEKNNRDVAVVTESVTEKALVLSPGNMPAIRTQKQALGLLGWTPQEYTLSMLPVRQLEQQRPCYLPLHENIVQVARDACYEQALPHGYVQYSEDQYVVGASGDLEYAPQWYVRSEVLDMIEAFVLPEDRRVALSVPLAWRVGFSTGWLSALGRRQAIEAVEGAMMLAALVRPLLLHPQEDMARVREVLPSRTQLLDAGFFTLE